MSLEVNAVQKNSGDKGGPEDMPRKITTAH